MTYWMLMRSGGTMIVEGPTQKINEATLRLFFEQADCIRYRDADKTNATPVKVTVLELWEKLEQINQMSLDAYNAPIRVEVSKFDGAKAQTVRVLRSAVAPGN